MAASCRATLQTLKANQRPVRLLVSETVNAEVMGALMMHFMLETIFCAGLLRVDPFDQPAVEQGKVLIREFLSEQV